MGQGSSGAGAGPGGAPRRPPFEAAGAACPPVPQVTRGWQQVAQPSVLAEKTFQR